MFIILNFLNISSFQRHFLVFVLNFDFFVLNRQIDLEECVKADKINQLKVAQS